MSLDVVNLLLVFVAALGGGWVARRLGYPSILGELAAGIVLGPPLLGLLQADDALGVIGKLGVVLLMLYIGLHLDPSSLGRAAVPGALAAIGGFVVPAGLGFGLVMLVEGDVVASLFVAVAMGVTSLATKSRILVDLGILNTRVAHVLMAGALFSDIAALVIFAGLLGFAATGVLDVGSLLTTTAAVVAYLGAVWVIGTRLFPRIGRMLDRREIDPSVLFLSVVAVGLAFAGVADAIGLHAILGAFLAGLFIREHVLGRDRLAAVEERARSVSVGLLAPVFFVTAGFDVSFTVFSESGLLLAAVVVLATLGKVVGTALFYLPSGHGFREGVAVGAGMNGRGAVEIIVAELALAAGIISTEIFSILVFMAIFTTATVPILLTRAVEWLRRNGELEADERSGVVIVGAGPVGRRMAAALADSSAVVLIDTSAEHCEAARREGLTAVRGSALDEEVLAAAGAAGTGTFVALTANSEVNLLSAQLAARNFGIPDLQVVLPLDASGAIHEMLRSIGGEIAFGRPIDISSWDVQTDQGRVSEMRFEVPDPDEAASWEPVPAGSPPGAVLPLAVLGEPVTSPYSSSAVLRTGATVLVLAREPDSSGTSLDGPAVDTEAPI